MLTEIKEGRILEILTIGVDGCNRNCTLYYFLFLIYSVITRVIKAWLLLLPFSELLALLIELLCTIYRKKAYLYLKDYHTRIIFQTSLCLHEKPITLSSLSSLSVRTR